MTRRQNSLLVTAGAAVVAVAVTVFLLNRTRDRELDEGSELTSEPPMLGVADATPATSDPEAAVAVPGVPGATIRVERSAHRVVRQDGKGGLVWATPLEGYLGLVRPPHLLVDSRRVYVTHSDGVTALDVKTGALLWHTPGPADRMLLTGNLLVATECSVPRFGRCVLARDAPTGAEVFRVPLLADGFDPLPIRDAAGLLLVQDYDDPGGQGLALLIDRGGRICHRFDRQVVAVNPWAEGDRLVLTSRDVVRLSGAGEVRWSVPFSQREWVAGGNFVMLSDGGLVAFLYCQIADGGVQLLRFDPATGGRVWSGHCAGLGVMHSQYLQEAAVAPDGDNLRVTSRGSSGTFVEVIDARNGRRVSRGKYRP